MQIKACIVVLVLCVGCSGPEEPAATSNTIAAEAPAETPEPTPPPEPALPDGAELLGGEFEFTGAHNGHELRHAVRYDGATFTRIVNGRTTAAGAARVVTSEAGRVSIEVTTDGAPPSVRTFVFSDTDNLFDAAAPELVFRRTAELEDVIVAADGSGATE